MKFKPLPACICFSFPSAGDPLGVGDGHICSSEGGELRKIRARLSMS